MNDHDPKFQVKGSPQQQDARRTLIELYESTPVPTNELLVNLPLYMRASTVAKLLYINELYELIVDKPGVVMEFGVWWGANLAIFSSLRAVYEPYNYARKVIGFDTFEGYRSVSAKDGTDELVAEGQYSVGSGYVDHLTRLLDYHEAENPMPHIEKYELVQGDATKTVNSYFEEHPETIIALAYFDMQLYEPTKACLEAVLPRLARGSVLAMDELNSSEFPGETEAFREVVGLDRYEIRRSRYLPDRSYVIVG